LIQIDLQPIDLNRYQGLCGIQGFRRLGVMQIQLILLLLHMGINFGKQSQLRDRWQSVDLFDQDDCRHPGAFIRQHGSTEPKKFLAFTVDERPYFLITSP
jgi:hypothetical protein